jgi:hypothetical protein
MAALAFLLAAIEFALVGFGVEFPADNAVRNLAAGLFLVALGLLLPGAIVLYRERSA